LFVDRQEAKSVFGQNPGNYHGFLADYTHGGTYQVDEDRGVVVGDLKKYTKFKIKQRDLKPRLLDGSEIEDVDMGHNRSQSVNSEFRSSKESPYKKFLKATNESNPDKQKNFVKLCNLYDFIKADGNRSKNNVVFNQSMDSNLSQRNQTPLKVDFKPKSVMKTPALMSRSRSKNVSFEYFPPKISQNSVAGSDYLDLRNKGYLTSDILGSNVTSDIVHYNKMQNNGKAQEASNRPAGSSPLMYRSNVQNRNSYSRAIF
jgi:hypothetical protein